MVYIYIYWVTHHILVGFELEKLGNVANHSSIAEIVLVGHDGTTALSVRVVAERSYAFVGQNLKNFEFFTTNLNS